ncbi:hypothetical protein DF185_03165 [Marinifilum breve]|uniref:PD-(D/E)XK nuclease family protein n=1 Tax=Marinifilum breve TaxID=2184082 RepID=A0A2V4AG69_9BACT|nr:PD-(D/E)XK nuclease family protein [Marinifilum breve]PXY03104.1 hypothetical protein DF185_03165 [Marinifilum breve]
MNEIKIKELKDVDIIKLASDFSKWQQKKKDELPYRINLIDEIGANENAHNRIFVKIISFEENGHFPFLRLFLNFLGDEFGKIKIVKPIFTVEKFRIDGLIRDVDGKYAIIIENKIHDAVDQENQIERYQSILKGRGYKESEIYTLYLTLKGGSPSENSFALNKRNSNYREINFKDDIIPLLEKHILPTCRVKDELLVSSIKQYIDHLNGILNQREIDFKMNKELTDSLLEELEINKATEKYEKLTKVDNALKEIENVASCLKEHYESVIKEELSDWKKKIKSDFINKDFVSNIDDTKNKKYFYLGIKLEYKEVEFSCSIGMDDYYSEPYYGITVRGCSKEEKNETIEEFIKDIAELKGFGESHRWYAYRRTKLENVITEYLEFCRKVIEKTVPLECTTSEQ